MPAPLRVDFACNGYARRRTGVALIVAGAASALLALGSYVQVQREIQALEGKLQTLGRAVRPALEPLSLDQPRLRALRQRLEASNRVLDALDQPWIKLFDEIESAGVEGIALLALEPDALRGSVRVAGEARDRDTLSRYLERLGALASLQDLRLNQHELRDGSEGAAVRFVVSARWARPA